MFSYLTAKAHERPSTIIVVAPVMLLLGCEPSAATLRDITSNMRSGDLSGLLCLLRASTDAATSHFALARADLPDIRGTVSLGGDTYALINDVPFSSSGESFTSEFQLSEVVSITLSFEPEKASPVVAPNAVIADDGTLDHAATPDDQDSAGTIFPLLDGVAFGHSVTWRRGTPLATESITATTHPHVFTPIAGLEPGAQKPEVAPSVAPTIDVSAEEAPVAPEELKVPVIPEAQAGAEALAPSGIIETAGADEPLAAPSLFDQLFEHTQFHDVEAAAVRTLPGETGTTEMKSSHHFVLVLPDGSVEPLDSSLLLGRKPTRQNDSDMQGARLVKVTDRAKRLSRTHARVEARTDEVIVTDLGSVNGTLIVSAAGDQVALTPHIAYAIQPGDELFLSESIRLTVEVAPL